MTRQEKIKLCHKFYLKLRAMHEDFVYLQKISDELRLDTTNIKIPLYEINLELQNYHDAAREMERDLDEKQQSDFVHRENRMMVTGN